MFYLKATSRTASSHNCGGRAACCNAARAFVKSVLLIRSAIEFSCGWWGVVVMCCMPCELYVALACDDVNALALSVIYARGSLFWMASVLNNCGIIVLTSCRRRR